MTPELSAYMVAITQSNVIYIACAGIGVMAGAAPYVLPANPVWLRRWTVALIVVMEIFILVALGLVYAQAA
jgi:hypothetical protein